MSGYTKLFSDLVTSTIWQEPNNCRVLWITMLALREKDNICHATVPALAKLSDITIEETEEYLNKFLATDKYSRSQEHEGRRIAVVDGGFLILNGAKYREKMNADERRESLREAQARFRQKKAAKPRLVKGGNPRGTMLPRPPKDPDA